MAVKTDSISRHALGSSPTTSEYLYQGKQHFQDVMHKEAAAESKHPYVIFTNIDLHTFLQDFQQQSHFYKEYFPQSNLLLAKMPTRAHDEAYHQLNKLIILKLAAMKLDNNLQLLGSADVVTPERTKRPDLSYLPDQLPAGRTDKWPAVVVESGYSESQSKLASDARWWLNASGGDVQTVLTISVGKKGRGITFEAWEWIGRPTRGDPGKMVPEAVQKVVVTPGRDSGPVHVTGGPLVIKFEKLFLRPAGAQNGEGDLVIDQNDLDVLADKVWKKLPVAGQTSNAGGAGPA